MSLVPIVPHFEPTPSGQQQACAERLAECLLREQPKLALSNTLRGLAPERIDDAPTLHLDDLSSIPLLSRFHEVSFLEDRARFRAGDGDFVATCGPHIAEYEAYCRDQLQLGTVEWLRPHPQSDPQRVAAACWTDRKVRHTLVQALRRDKLAYIHPHMGNQAVWSTALLLQRASRRPLRVIAPPPELTKAVNDKVWFALVVERLFGDAFVPRTAYAFNLVTLARLVQHFAAASRRVVIKFPDSAGGAGNLVLDGTRFRGRPLGKIRKALADTVRTLNWCGERLLVGSWETKVLSTPSTQLWIPPEQQGLPLVEGLFEQKVEGTEGLFVGARPAHFPRAVSQPIIDRSWLLARVFQRLGYVGRCSFDFLLVGDRLESCQHEFVECNGRWGGTSGPMTLVNRLFGDWVDQPYATRECVIRGLERVNFGAMLQAFAADLFDARTGQGDYILYNPGGLACRPGIDVVALNATWEIADYKATVEFPKRLAALVKSRNGAANSVRSF